MRKTIYTLILIPAFLLTWVLFPSFSGSITESSRTSLNRTAENMPREGCFLTESGLEEEEKGRDHAPFLALNFTPLPSYLPQLNIQRTFPSPVLLSSQVHPNSTGHLRAPPLLFL
jgi:hypothetical protein